MRSWPPAWNDTRQTATMQPAHGAGGFGTGQRQLERCAGGRAQPSSLASCLQGCRPTARGATSHTLPQVPPSPSSHLRGPPRTTYSQEPQSASCSPARAHPPQSPPSPRKPKRGFQRAPAHGMELDLQQTKAAWPRGAEIPGHWHHTPARHPAARMHCRRAAERQSCPLNRQPPWSPEPEPPPGEAAHGRTRRGPKSGCPDSRAPRKVRACPVPFQTRGPRAVRGMRWPRRIPPRPPCPHLGRCQLKQKTHPQVGFWSALARAQVQMTGCGLCSDLPAPL